MQKEIDQFLRKQVSKNTIINYTSVFNKFQKWEHGNLDTVLSGNKWTKDYTNWLLEHNTSNRTVNYHLTVLGSWKRDMTGERLLYDRLKEKKKEVEFLTDDEVKNIYENAGMPLQAVIKFMVDTGVRIGELCAISERVFDVVPSEITITGKGDKTRIIVVNDEVQKLLQPGLLFGEKLSVRKLQRQLAKHGEWCRLGKRLHPHMLRHTFATRMLYAGADITEVQYMLGHSYLATTQIYTHITNDRVREVWRSLQNARSVV